MPRITSLIWIVQNDKAFNASKEDMEFIDNNEETNKVAHLDVKTEN